MSGSDECVHANDGGELVAGDGACVGSTRSSPCHQLGHRVRWDCADDDAWCADEHDAVQLYDELHDDGDDAG